MARIARLKFAHPEDGYYHVVNRTVMNFHLFKEKEKEFFLKTLKDLTRIYFVRVATFTIMSDHFHLIFQMIPSERIPPKDFKQRLDIFFELMQSLHHRDIQKKEEASFRRRFGDMSRFIQDLNQLFSRWYNRRNDCRGHLWSERYKSVLLGGERALLACMVYVELNSVRAGLVKRPEDYGYSGLAAYLKGGESASWLAHETVDEAMRHRLKKPLKSRVSIFKHYRDLIHHEAQLPGDSSKRKPQGVSNLKLSEDFDGSDILNFRRRIRYFSDGLILGSETFCREQFQRCRRYFATKNDKRTGHLIRYKSDNGPVTAPPDNLLHLHSIRSFAMH